MSTAFKLSKVSLTVLAAVSFLQPQADGTDQTVTLHLDFKRLPERQIEQLFNDYPYNPADNAKFSDILERNADLFSHVIAGWDVRDDDDKPVPFTPEVWRQVITGPDGMALSEATFKVWNNLRFGIREDVAKNLPMLPAPMPAAA